MQTLSIPYSCDEAGREAIRDMRRIYSAMVRSAFNLYWENPEVRNPKKRKARRETDHRRLVKARFEGVKGVDAWIAHCATRDARDMRKAGAPDHTIFGGRKDYIRRAKGLISNEEWKELRLRPLCSLGHKSVKGNRHFRLSADGRTCQLTMLHSRDDRNKKVTRTVTLHLAHMQGKQGQILRQAALLAADKKINITFKIDAERLYISIDPNDLPHHPEVKRPVKFRTDRAIGIDLNPEWIGISCIEAKGKTPDLPDVKVLDHCLITNTYDHAQTREETQEFLAGVCSRILGMARQRKAHVIVMEANLGMLKGGSQNSGLNGKLNKWARSMLFAMLKRKAALCGIQVIDVWGGYSTTIGNIAFKLPDACASATEIARRGFIRLANKKELLPVFEPQLIDQWKETVRGQVSAAQAAFLLKPFEGWVKFHQEMKTSKLGYRRPHPILPKGLSVSELHGLEVDGSAVVRLRHKHRRGLLIKPLSGHASRTHSPIQGRVNDVLSASTL